FLADVTTIHYLDDRPVRNGNVMYEVGLAHAVRLPEEVILLRSDDDDLLFDVANVRISHYRPDDDPEPARKLVSEVIVEALKEIDLKKHLAVRKAAESLDFVSWTVLSDAAELDGVQHPEMKTMGQGWSNAARQSGIKRLLEIGALTTSYLTLTPEIIKSKPDMPAHSLFKYCITPFGESILKHASDRMGVMSPEIRELLEKHLGHVDGGG
ncbi:MAG: hypothetical protein O7D34_10555, partial [Ignavibacteria bacterium]|nr:hypothetical protein [Ignavibacteria bacterium]